MYLRRLSSESRAIYTRRIEMVTNKYVKLDGLITGAVRNRPSTFSQLLTGEVRDECNRLNNEHTGPEW